MVKQELLNLAKGLRRQIEQSHHSQWHLEGPAAKAKASFQALEALIHSCRKCPLGHSRLNAVVGVGSYQAQVMFVGEGPGFEEDHKGEPFVGRSGQLLDKILESIGLSRQTVYICNIVKCHPMKNPADSQARGNDRPPTPEEIAACRPFLDTQIGLINPKVIVALGAVAARVLLGLEEPISKIRGKWHFYTPQNTGRPLRLLPTFHPAALLRNPDLKKDVWTDMKNLRKELQG